MILDEIDDKVLLEFDIGSWPVHNTFSSLITRVKGTYRFDSFFNATFAQCLS
jgi:hypothetical protein